MVTRVGRVGRDVDQDGIHRLVLPHGGVYRDIVLSVGGGRSISIGEVWQGMGELGKEGEVQALAIRLLGKDFLGQLSRILRRPAVSVSVPASSAQIIMSYTTSYRVLRTLFVTELDGQFFVIYSCCGPEF